MLQKKLSASVLFCRYRHYRHLTLVLEMGELILIHDLQTDKTYKFCLTYFFCCIDFISRIIVVDEYDLKFLGSIKFNKRL